MHQEPTTGRVPATPGRYEIRLQGELDGRWATWFDGMTVTSGEGTTVVSGHLPDQAAVHGVLERVRDLGLGLISVTRITDPTTNQEEE